MRNPVWPSSCVTPAGTSTSLTSIINWMKTHTTHTHTFFFFSFFFFFFFFLLFFFFHLTYSRWTSSLPSCLWSQRIFPSLPGSRLTFFYRDASSALLQLVNQLTFPRFPLRKKEHKSYFGKNRTHDFRTSRCAAYLLDHSGDERLHNTYSTSTALMNPYGVVIYWAMGKNGSSRCGFGQKRAYLKTIAAESVVGRI